MWISIYKSLMKKSTPLLEVYLGQRLQKGKEDPLRFHERRGRPTRKRGSNPLVWFHAASVGESLSLLVLIQRMRRDAPGIDIMVTTGTVTSAKLMADRLPDGAFHQYMPVDHPVWTESFLDHWRPDFVIWSESEFWPNMLTGIQTRKIPAVLLNARMSASSFRRWRMAPGTIRKILQTFQLCLGQNEAEVDRLKQLGAPAARVSGNLKYAALPLPYDTTQLEALTRAVGNRPHLLWASTHPGEEEVACRVHQQLQAKYPQLLTIIVPRHPARGAAVETIAQKAGLTAQRRAAGNMLPAAEQIYIADTLGELGLFYRLCRSCIVGGSFVPVGGHNPIEPAQLNCQIFYGPYMFNFAAIHDDFMRCQGAVQVNGEEALVSALTKALQDPENFSAMADAAYTWTQQQSHVVDDIFSTITPFIKELQRKRDAT